MRDFLVLVIVIAAVTFFAPMILRVFIFALCAAAILSLLMRFGLLAGMFRGLDRRGKVKWKWTYSGLGGKTSRTSAGRGRAADNSPYQTEQEGEEITLPETALRKENGSKKTGV